VSHTTHQVGDRTYRVISPRALEMHLGVEKVYEWGDHGVTGYVAVRRVGPLLCSCHLSICSHIADVRGFEDDAKVWDAPPKVPA
jgi:hypothetical protein